MELFNLPQNTKVQKVIPKKSFEPYANAKQRKLFTDLVNRIIWSNKLSTDTVNLESKEVKEIQVFHIELKQKSDIAQILNIIDKAIPYFIVFVVEYEDSFYISTSKKHPHPVNEDNAVIDWTFKSDWMKTVDNNYTINLKKNLDAVYHDFCLQLSGKEYFPGFSLDTLIEFNKLKDSLSKEIAKLKNSIAGSKQFKEKVELNIKLKILEKQLQEIFQEA